MSGVFQVVESSVPRIDKVTFTSTPAAAGYGTGDIIQITVTFSEAVTVTGSPSLTFQIGAELAFQTGSKDRSASYVPAASTATDLRFEYTVVESDYDRDGISIAANVLDLNGGTIKAQAGDTDAILFHRKVHAEGGHNVQDRAFIVEGGVNVSSTPGSPGNNIYYAFGETIEVTVTFDEPVTVDTGGGTPFIEIDFGGGSTRQASYDRGSSTTVLVFAYTVASGDLAPDGIAVAANALSGNSGEIRSVADGQDAYLDNNTFHRDPNHRVNGSLTSLPATLTSLTLSDLTLSPAFHPATEEYESSATYNTTDATHALITIDATAESGATAVILPADARPDLAGHQVMLHRGANDISIIVSRSVSQDRTYTVTVNATLHSTDERVSTTVGRSRLVFTRPGSAGTGKNLQIHPNRTPRCRVRCSH